MTEPLRPVPRWLHGWAILTAFLFVLINLIVDILYGFLNPQIRLG